MEDLLPIVLAMLASGLLAGFLAGLLGIGGGIVTVPILFTAFGLVGAPAALQMHLTVATSLAIIVPTAIFSARSHAARDAVSLDILKSWGPWIALGAVAGAWGASLLDTGALMGFFAVMAFLMGLKLFLPLDHKVIGDQPPRGIFGAVTGGLIGLFSSLMGIGGATFSVPVMTLYGMAMHRAVGTAAVLGLVISLPATLGYVAGGYGQPGLPPWSLGYVNLAGVLIIAPAAMAMAPLGVALAHRLPHRRLSLLFGLFLFIAAGRMALPLLGF
jgi:uncharacterized membrane protein YfcA